jgi:hypothetical protein
VVRDQHVVGVKLAVNVPRADRYSPYEQLVRSEEHKGDNPRAEWPAEPDERVSNK